jgi:hypothetical protein
MITSSRVFQREAGSPISSVFVLDCGFQFSLSRSAFKMMKYAQRRAIRNLDVALALA